MREWSKYSLNQRTYNCLCPSKYYFITVLLLTLLEEIGMIEKALTEFWFLPVRERKEVRLYSKAIKRKTPSAAFLPVISFEIRLEHWLHPATILSMHCGITQT